MGTREHRGIGETQGDASAMELWAAGELHDEVGSGGTAAVVGAMAAALCGLAAFFVVFGPGV